MKKTLSRIIGCFMVVCLLTTTVFAAQIRPSVTNAELKENENTVSFDITLKTSSAFAGAEFGIKPSASDVVFQSLTYLDDIKGESTVKTIKNGVLYFGFFAGTNKFEAGTYQVARLTYSYAGTAPRTISLDSSKIVTIDEVTGQTAGDTSSDPFTVTVTRAPSGGGDIGGGDIGGGDIGGGDIGGGGSGGGIVPPPVEPSKPSTEDIFFVDVPRDAWFYDSVQYAAKNDLFNGVGNNRFAPDAPMTRAMLVTVLDRLNSRTDSPVKSGKTVIFNDVPAGTWYSDSVLWAAGADVVNGIGNDLFAPNDNVTREQVAAILYRYTKAAGKNPQTNPSAIEAYRDADKVSAYAVEPMNWAISQGIINGKGGAQLDPQGFATRAEVAKILTFYLGGEAL